MQPRPGPPSPPPPLRAEGVPVNGSGDAQEKYGGYGGYPPPGYPGQSYGAPQGYGGAQGYPPPGYGGKHDAAWRRLRVALACYARNDVREAPSSLLTLPDSQFSTPSLTAAAAPPPSYYGPPPGYSGYQQPQQVYVQQQPGNPGADACCTACLAALCCCLMVDCLT